MADVVVNDGGCRIIITDCPTCGIRHGVPERIVAVARESGRNVYCPNGHTWVYKNSDMDKLRRARDDAQRDAEAKRIRIEQLSRAVELERVRADRAERRIPKKTQAKKKAR
jgi:hypothetical protein